MTAHPAFDYDEAFSRNLGWVTEWEQLALRARTVAIAGMGGVGGVHLLTLTRLGVGGFRIADFDRFDVVNFNRQAGAAVSTLGRPKVDVMAEMALDVNPELRLARFPEGVTEGTLDAFLDGADLFVDGLDFFALPVRRRVFARCAELGIPAVTAAPIGMGVGFLAFVPGGMSFEEYFRLEGQPEEEQYLRFLMGVAPRGLHRSYLVDPARVDLAGRRGPSTAMACQLCAGVTGVAALKLLLGRGDVKPAPYHHHFDPYAGTFAVTKLPRGNAGRWQRAKLAVARRAFAGMSRGARAQADAPAGAPEPSNPAGEGAAPGGLGPVLDPILSAARWAPSGDNAQAWHFEPDGEDAVVVVLATEAASNVYEFRGGEPSLLSGGMLLESLRIAAGARGRGMEWEVIGRADPYRIRVRFPERPGAAPDPLLVPLLAPLALRSVDRRPYRTRPLRAGERAALEAALAPELRVEWHEGVADRWRFARLGARATDIRLRIPEAFRVHRRVIDWSNRHSRTGIPSEAVGLDRATVRLMRWAMQSWPRMHGLNRTTGTLAAAAQLDLAPGLGCAGFFVVRPADPAAPHAAPGVASGADRVERLLRAGQHVQRFWLTATRLGLAVQPNLATLIFADYGAAGVPFTESAAARDKAAKLARSFRRVTGHGPEAVVFLGRVGEPRPRLPVARSVRRPMSDLVRAGSSAQAIPRGDVAERGDASPDATAPKGDPGQGWASAERGTVERSAAG